MNTDLNTIRLLGAAQLFVFVASMFSERLLASVVGSGSRSDILVNISKNLTRMRISNLVATVNSLGIIVLGVLFYIVFYQQYKIIALIALGFLGAEAITLAVSKIGTYALIPLSQEFVAEGAPEAPDDELAQDQAEEERHRLLVGPQATQAQQQPLREERHQERRQDRPDVEREDVPGRMERPPDVSRA